MEFVTLNNQVSMPILGYGVFQISDLDQCEQCVVDAIHVGYRLIDTAQAYGNEEAVGKAIKRSGVSREEIFITTKVWISNAGYQKAKESIETSMSKLQVDYIDLVLIHQPFNDYYGTYRALSELQKEGKIRAIGVSNFYPDRLIDMCKYNEIVPAVNQVEIHPFHQQVEAIEVMKKYGVQPQAWAPFAQGKNDLFTNPTLTEIGAKYDKSASQVALRFLIQKGVSVLPKTVNKERMIQNFEVFDFRLTDEEVSLIESLDTKESSFFSHYDPSIVEYITGLSR